MKALFGLLFYTICFQFLVAQENAPRIVCGNDLLLERWREHYPDFANSIQEIFDAANFERRSLDDSLIVRVVVHVVWNQPEENLHDSIIYNQLRILNADFKRLNADTGNLRPVFHPVAGKANIHFELVEITRVQTNALFEVDVLGTNLLPEVKHAADGGSDAWDTEHYLNIWVCKIQPIEIFGFPVGQILGFAFPPAGLEHWPKGTSAPVPEEDGVVIDFRVFGSNNPNPIEVLEGSGQFLTIEGRTPVHEVGHYLGLRHIWGDGGTFGPNDCAQSDGVDDTPFANAQSSFDCDPSKNTCEGIEEYYLSDVPDMVENYMDYASEDCMNMFTHGQVEIMRNVLLGVRSGLLEPESAVEREDVFQSTVFPIPAGDELIIRISSGHQIDHIQLLHINGQVVPVSWTTNARNGEQEFRANVKRCSAGVYCVRIVSGNTVSSQMLVVH